MPVVEFYSQEVGLANEFFQRDFPPVFPARPSTRIDEEPSKNKSGQPAAKEG
jgi:hypothetical protein